MDNHKLITISILQDKNMILFFLKNMCEKPLEFSCMKKKQNIFLVFLKSEIFILDFLKYWRKSGNFNIGSDIKMKYLKKKHIFMFSKSRDFFLNFWIFFEILEKNQIFLIIGSYLTIQVYNLILGKNYWKTMWWIKNNFKMVFKFLKNFLEIWRACLARHTNKNKIKPKGKSLGRVWQISPKDPTRPYFFLKKIR
jgi:hypothetical protein